MSSYFEHLQAGQNEYMAVDALVAEDSDTDYSENGLNAAFEESDTDSDVDSKLNPGSRSIPEKNISKKDNLTIGKRAPKVLSDELKKLRCTSKRQREGLVDEIDPLYDADLDDRDALWVFKNKRTSFLTPYAMFNLCARKDNVFSLYGIGCSVELPMLFPNFDV